MSKVNNPPAFPLNAGEFGIEPSPGMSLRDYFAGQALQGVLASPDECPGFSTIEGAAEHYATLSYQYADAMLKERARG